jgi:hypothetical protein
MGQSLNPWGISPYSIQSPGVQTLPQQLYGQTLPNPFIGSGIGSVSGNLPFQQIPQLLQIVPQQLQQLQHLQQLQLMQLQQLLQLVPAQLQQLQQLVQLLPHQIQQLQQWQPFGTGISAPFGLMPQAFAGQPATQVM